MTKNNPGRRFPLSGSGEALFRLLFFPDEIDAGPCLSLGSAFFLKHVLMPWTVGISPLGVGLTGRGLPFPVSIPQVDKTPPRPASVLPNRFEAAPLAINHPFAFFAASRELVVGIETKPHAKSAKSGVRMLRTPFYVVILDGISTKLLSVVS